MALGRLSPSIGAGTLLAGFRTRGDVGHQQIYGGWHRSMSRQSYVRNAPGQVFMVERSHFQPVNIPAKVQVDVNLEYSTAYRAMLGYAGYLERKPYTQGGPGQSVQQPRPQLPYTIQAPRYSTLPSIFGVGG